jgi:hypothetical protein
MIIATENALMVCSSVKTQVDAGRATRPEGASACQFQWVTTTVMKQLVALHPLTYLFGQNRQLPAKISGFAPADFLSHAVMNLGRLCCHIPVQEP